MNVQEALEARAGAHTDFKNKMKADLNKRVAATIVKRAGPSWEERMDKAIKGFRAKSSASEAEMKKNLTEAIEKGRSRPCSCPIRPPSETPNNYAMLAARKKEMRELESEYKGEVERIHDKMMKREPLFRLSEVNAAFKMQEERMKERKKQMTQDEHERWEHLRSLEIAASSRPMLIEDSAYKPPKKSSSTPVLGKDANEGALDAGGALHAATFFSPTEVFPKDKKIKDAISQPWFQKTEWGKEVAKIRERADNRVKLHEIQYPNKGDGHALNRNRLMHTSPSQVRNVLGQATVR